jgi:SAM-dependent methyltransferase
MLKRQSSVIRNLWKIMIPSFIRRSVPLRNIKNLFISHDDVYDEHYFTHDIDVPATVSAPFIAASIARDFQPRKLVDVGCGTGALLKELSEAGVEVLGLEYAEAAIRLCKARNLQIKKFDIEAPAQPLLCSYCVAVSMEVAEHLPAAVSDRYIDLLTSLAPVVIFTAAPPGQGGRDHVNEQPPGYWLEKFAARGYELLERLTEDWKKEWKSCGKVEYWYHANLMVFAKPEKSNTINRRTPG